MAGMFPTPLPSSHSRTILYDVYGLPILTVGVREYIITNPDGTVDRYEDHALIQLVCGTQWNERSQPPIPLGVCMDCREPRYEGFRRRAPRHGIVALPRARLCEGGCGRLCCPTHILRTADSRWLCHSCARGRRARQALGAFLRTIFFAEEHD